MEELSKYIFNNFEENTEMFWSWYGMQMSFLCVAFLVDFFCVCLAPDSL